MNGKIPEPLLEGDKVTASDGTNTVSGEVTRIRDTNDTSIVTVNDGTHEYDFDASKTGFRKN